jgi:hypothetical protein
VLGVAGSAAAGNVLFQYETQNCAQGNVVDPMVSNVIDDCAAGTKVIGTVSGNTLMTTPTASGANFTIPTKIFSAMGSFSATAAPTFPYFKGTFTRFNKAGTLMAGNWTPGVTKVFIDSDTAYPYASTVPTGFVRAKVGPKGMAGPAPVYQRTYYEFTLVTGTLVFDAIAAITLNLGGDFTSLGAALSENPVLGGFETNVRQTLTPTSSAPVSSNGNVVFLEPNIWAFTGTVTVDAPAPAAVTYFIKTAMDNRTPAGASGTIQVVSAMLAHQYTITSLPVPLDGSGVVSDLARQTGRAQLSTFQFLPVPEPGQMVLLGAGVFGLAGIWMRRRR